MKNTPLRAILVHSGPDSGAFYLTDGTLLTESFQGRIKGHRTIYRYQPDFLYPSQLYLPYPKDYLSYIADPDKDAELQKLLRCWDEGEGPIASREECSELVVRRKGQPTLRVIVRPHEHPRLPEHLEWLEEHRSDRPTTEFKAEPAVCFGFTVDYRISLTSVASAVPCQQPDKSEITRIGQEVATEHNISLKDLRKALKPYLGKRDLPYPQQKSTP